MDTDSKEHGSKKEFSDAELAATEMVFPKSKLFMCDFHREQAWERLVKVNVCHHAEIK